METKIGVYICKGCDIGKALDIDKLSEIATDEKGAALCKTHDVLCSSEGVDLIKIDVEGCELEVLEGARRTITASRPVLIVEIKDGHYDRVADFAAELGYDVSRLIDVIGVQGSAENFILRTRP